MRVNLAAQVLSASVASVLKAFGSPEVAATAKLCEMVDDIFDCLYVRSTREHEKKRKPLLAPYTSLYDRRFVNNAFRDWLCYQKSDFINFNYVVELITT